MNKLFFALLFIAFVGSLCFAEEAAVSSATTANSGTTTLPFGTMTFTGTINKVSSGTFLKKTNLEIIVKDSKGEESTFVLANNAVITDKDGSAVSSSWIGNNDKVTIEYTVDEEGVKTAKSIKVLSGW